MSRSGRIRWTACIGVAAMLSPMAVAAKTVVSSSHDFSVAGGARRARATGEDEICVFCHAPHGQLPSTPLWNRVLPALTYTLYSSSTLVAVPGQPTGSSKLCLSCHDGTIALGEVRSRSSVIPGLARVTGRANLETDLSDDHPVSFVYDSGLAAANPEIVDPLILSQGPIRIDEAGQMQCTTCHDPHASDFPAYLVVDPTRSGLCVECHDKVGWVGSSHDMSPASWNGLGVDPWPHTDWTTVSENGCQSCHTPHGAGLPERLLVFGTEEENCLSCHNGNVSATDIEAELTKPSRHPVRNSLGVHDPVETFDAMQRHVECQDCHDPHAVTDTPATPPFAGGSLTAVPGLTLQGARTESVQFEYEVCFKCHAQDTTLRVPRVAFEPDIRLRFDVTNPSYHPVAAVGRNRNVPSLLSPLSDSSQIYCTDCHANDQGPGADGNGPAGPHASSWPPLLERRYVTTDGTPENSAIYALCYKCHSRTSILNDESFKEHRKHIDGENASCATCHDPHGIPNGQGNPVNNAHLINFSTLEVTPNQGGQLFFEDRGTFRGACFLSCHGEDHDDASY